MRNDFHHREVVEASFDRGRTFMLVEIDGDKLDFQPISRTGQTVDSGEITRQVQLERMRPLPMTVPESNRLDCVNYHGDRFQSGYAAHLPAVG